MNAVDPERCPLCGEPNACGAAEAARCGTSCRDCWCFGATLDAAALARVPAAARGTVCLCARCATKPPPAGAGDEPTGTDQDVGRGRA